jgi:hypothetical protein
MKSFQKTIVFLAVFFIFSTGNMIFAEQSEIQESQVSKLPQKVKEAVEKAKDGIKVTGFAIEEERGRVYEVRGTVGSNCYEIEVTSEGRVLEIEDCD